MDSEDEFEVEDYDPDPVQDCEIDEPPKRGKKGKHLKDWQYS